MFFMWCIGWFCLNNIKVGKDWIWYWVAIVGYLLVLIFIIWICWCR